VSIPTKRPCSESHSGAARNPRILGVKNVLQEWSLTIRNEGEEGFFNWQSRIKNDNFRGSWNKCITVMLFHIICKCIYIFCWRIYDARNQKKAGATIKQF